MDGMRRFCHARAGSRWGGGSGCKVRRRMGGMAVGQVGGQRG